MAITATGPLKIAASQFPVSGDRRRNARYILKHIEQAAKCGAHVVQFPETALPGYAPCHLGALDGYDWEGLGEETGRIAASARGHGIWVILGSMRRAEDGSIRNTLMAISDEGRCEAAYDKRRLYGRETSYYLAGERPSVFDIRGVRCGLLVCYDNCFPELYVEYRERGVELIFNSFYNAANAVVTSIGDLMSANLLVRAADHRFWISASNSSEPHSPLPASIVKPDGSAVRARRNVAGIVIESYSNEGLGWTYDNRRLGAA